MDARPGRDERKPCELRRGFRQSLRYFGIGAIATAVDGALYLALTRGLRFPYVLASLASSSVGVTTSFFLNAFFNFRKTTNLPARAACFYGVCGIGLLVSTGILALGTGALGLPDIPVKLAAVLAAGLIQFLFNKFVTFGLI